MHPKCFYAYTLKSFLNFYLSKGVEIYCDLSKRHKKKLLDIVSMFKLLESLEFGF